MKLKKKRKKRKRLSYSIFWECFLGRNEGKKKVKEAKFDVAGLQFCKQAKMWQNLL